MWEGEEASGREQCCAQRPLKQRAWRGERSDKQRGKRCEKRANGRKEGERPRRGVRRAAQQAWRSAVRSGRESEWGEVGIARANNLSHTECTLTCNKTLYRFSTWESYGRFWLYLLWPTLLYLRVYLEQKTRNLVKYTLGENGSILFIGHSSDNSLQTNSRKNTVIFSTL